MDRLPVEVGELVADKYRIERLIGRGGMGSVFEATHVHILQRVALKFLAAKSLDDTDASTRFLREARASAALKSEHVARVLDVGVLPNKVPYLVIEFLEGIDLMERLREGPLAVDEAVDLVKQACDALGEAHRLGIVHRDVKPHNLFLVPRPTGAALLKVLDFGIAKSNDPRLGVESGITSSFTVMGTPHYMAPEQMMSTRNVDARADVWALGVCLYQCLTARLPFESTNLLELGSLVLNQPHVPVTEHRTDVPRQIVAIIERCLQKDPNGRFADANDLHAVLNAYTRSATDQIVITPRASAPFFAEKTIKMGDAPTTTAFGGDDAKTIENTLPPKSQTPLYIAAAAAMAAFTALGIAVATRRPTTPPPPPVSAAAPSAPTPTTIVTVVQTVAAPPPEPAAPASASASSKPVHKGVPTKKGPDIPKTAPDER